ncbi:MAG: TonB-dependent receptor, partial [Acidobacteriota bacterium]|nr:TonB-dependent receptor [Acidobacteriota bacterium]
VDATNISSNEGSLSDNIAPAPETLQEVKLQTSLYDASTGRSGGGNFQLVTRSGGNDFRGNAYYYLQNKKLTANEFFFQQEGIEKPRADRNEAGFTIGGPIIKDKFFFFGGYQYTKAVTGFVPTASSRSVLPRAFTVLGSDRSATAIAAAFNQFNNCATIGGCLTAADISPVAVAIFNRVNPVTGGFILPSLSGAAGVTNLGIRDQAGTGAFQFGSVQSGGITSRTLARNNELVAIRSVEPSRFKQNQATIKLDANLTDKDILSGTFFYANFPGFDSFPDPSSLVSPFTLLRDDKNRTLATSYTRIISSSMTNEFRFGYFYLNNTRSLDDPFLTEELTGAAVGIINPALAFDDSPGTRRLGHFIGRNNLANFSFGGPNDSFNRRKQKTLSFSDNLSYVTGNHTFKFGGEYRRYQYDSNLPEEQATEFEKFDNFTQLLTGNAQEADTQFGITNKSFRFQDFGFYVTDDWKVTQNLTLNVGVRYEFFGLPTEKDGRIGNFDFTGFESCFTQSGGSLANCDNIATGFIVPGNVAMTGLPTVDAAINATRKAGNNHTLAKQDKNNFMPRIGVAYKINDRLVVRGGYGLFYDRPSAAFINTVFSNYPFLREVEITSPGGNVPIANAFNNTSTAIPLNQWLPFRVLYPVGATSGGYTIRDNTPIFFDARGNRNPLEFAGGTCSATVLTGCARGNIAETFEFRAVDRNLSSPYVHQYNVGVQYEIVRDLLFEARYIGTKGRNLLQAVAFNQGFDLNDPNTPDHIYERFNQAYISAGSPRGALRAASTARERGRGIAFGFANSVTGNAQDLNLAPNGSVINFEARVPLLGFNVPEALLLTNGSYSDYNSAQFSLTKRFSNNLQFNMGYTFSKSIDNNSSDPGSTAGSGKPDVPNTGFVTQGDQRNLDNNRGLSDFDRTHRFSASFLYRIPNFGFDNEFANGWEVSSFVQLQSGSPFTVFASEPEISTVAQYGDVVRGSGGLYRLGFGRPNIICSAEDAINDFSQANLNNIINRNCFSSPLGQNGNLGRNTFRGSSQKRIDLGIVKRTRINERMNFEIGLDVFNILNTRNFAVPNVDLQDSTDFGRITNTVGGPRLAQIRAKFNF